MAFFPFSFLSCLLYACRLDQRSMSVGIVENFEAASILTISEASPSPSPSPVPVPVPGSSCVLTDSQIRAQPGARDRWVPPSRLSGRDLSSCRRYSLSAFGPCPCACKDRGCIWIHTTDTISSRPHIAGSPS